MCEKENLVALISGGETGTVEFKEAPVREVAKAVAAFSSSEGGVLLVGVTDQGDVVGLQNTDIALAQIRDWVDANVFPRPSYFVRVCAIGDAEIVVVEVSKGSEPVYFFRDNPYYRNNASSQRMTAHEVHRRYVQAKVIGQLHELGEEITASHPNRHTAALIFNQSELATMRYEDLLNRLVGDLRPHFEPRNTRPTTS